MLRFFRVCDSNFPGLVSCLFSWRCPAASTYYFLHAAINFHPPSVTVSTHTSASSDVAFQTPGCRSVSNRSTLSPLGTLKVSEHKPLRQPPAAHSDELPAHQKSFLVRNVVSMLSHRVISSARLYEVIRWSGLWPCVPIMRSKTR